MKRVLVCGATGFIGRNLAERFVRHGGYQVTAVCNRRPPFELPGLRWENADLTDSAQAARVVRNTDFLIQAAATTSGAAEIAARPYLHVTDNAVMNSHIFRAAFENRVEHVIFFSCSIMYGSSDAPLAETDFDPRTGPGPQYFAAGWTKVYLEKMCEFYAGMSGAKYTVIRHSNVYGPHDKFDLERSHVTGATITKVMTARDGRVTVWGNGEETRDLLYVDDLADFVERALERQPGRFGLYNCGWGMPVSVGALVRKIVEKSGRRVSVVYDPARPTIKTNIHLDCSKAERELGWRANTSLDDGIARTIEWWRQNVGTDL